jgi:hypothetical protein
VLSQATVNRIADELLERARASKFGFTDPSGVPVSPLYRCEDLARLPPGLQAEIVSKAIWAVGTSYAFVLLVLGLMAGMVFLHVEAPVVLGRPLPFTAMLVAIPFAPLLQVALVRRAVRRIAERVAAGWPYSA